MSWPVVYLLKHYYSIKTEKCNFFILSFNVDKNSVILSWLKKIVFPFYGSFMAQLPSPNMGENVLDLKRDLCQSQMALIYLRFDGIFF